MRAWLYHDTLISLILLLSTYRLHCIPQSDWVTTRNILCGTWYLPHSRVHYDRHCHFSLISTSGLKFDSRNCQDGQPASSCQISWRSVKPFRRYGDFSISQDGDRRHLGFLNFRNFNSQYGYEVQTESHCQISWRSVIPLQWYDNYSFIKMAAEAILDF